MEPKEYKNFLLEIYKVEAEKYNKTREIQWKMNIAIWTTLLVGIYAKAQHENPVLNFDTDMLKAASCAYLVLHFLFILGIHISLNKSQQRMDKCATQLLEKNTEELPNWHFYVKDYKAAGGFWEYLQFGFTLFLLLIFNFG